MPNFLFRFATVSGQGIHWFLKPKRSITPSQLGWLYAALCLVSLGVVFGFWQRGAKLALPFAGLELAALGAAFLAVARHACDGERIALSKGRLVVKRDSGGRCERIEFPSRRVRVEPQAGDGSLIELSALGRSVRGGRYVRPELRSALAREIRLALRDS